MLVEAVTDRPESRFSPGTVLYTDGGSSLTVERFEATAKAPLLTFSEISDREAAEPFRNTRLYIPSGQRRVLEEEEFWPEDLVGMEVVDPEGARMGRVAEVEAGTGQDRLIVDTGDATVTVPFVTEIVPEVDQANRRIVVVLPEGLTD